MMRIDSKIIISCLLFMLLIPLYITPTVQAAAVFADGEYTLPFQVLQETSDDISATSDYMESPATLLIKDGDMQVIVTLKNSSWWQTFEILTPSGTYEAVKILSEDQGNDTRLVAFDLYDLEQTLHAQIHIIVTGIPGFEYDHSYNIRFKFDHSHLPLLTETQQTDESDSRQEEVMPPETAQDVTPESEERGDADGQAERGANNGTDAELEAETNRGTDPELEAGANHGMNTVTDVESEHELDRHLEVSEIDPASEEALITGDASVGEAAESQRDTTDAAEDTQEEHTSSTKTVMMITIAGLCLLVVLILLIMRKRK